MIKAMYTAASGMQAQQTELDVIANNLANVQTAGFKRSMTHFEDLLYTTLQQPGAINSDGSGMAGAQIGSGSRLVSTTKVFTTGTMSQTGGNLDFAIQGDGFFELQGLGGGRVFTRDGRFFKDANGDLVTAQGLKIVPNIKVPQEAVRIDVTADGTVSFQNGETTQEIGKLQLIRFVNPAGLSSLGNNLYEVTANSGDPQSVQPGTEGAGTIMQGMSERSNVDVASELISLILAQRAFETNSKAIRVADEMLNTSNNLSR